MSESKRTPVGRIVGAFGIRGQVKVEMITSFESRFDKGNILFLDGKPLKIEASQFHKGRPLIKLAGINTMSEAETLQWKILEAEGEPEMDDDEYLIEDLIGLKVVTVEGEELGEVDDIEDYPAHEVVLVGEIRIPLVDEFIKDIDLDKEVMTVKLIYGMKPGEE
ncbi:MAG: 16S rRNA processing protein RimM [Armatimonadetes bacterium]|nr:16S rRNA processing protein RimM [Armatimonadota bacterium]